MNHNNTTLTNSRSCHKRSQDKIIHRVILQPNKTIQLNLNTIASKKQSSNSLLHILQQKNTIIMQNQSYILQLLEQISTSKQQNQNLSNTINIFQDKEIKTLQSYQQKNHQNLKELEEMRNGILEMRNQIDQLTQDKNTLGKKYHQQQQNTQLLTKQINILTQQNNQNQIIIKQLKKKNQQLYKQHQSQRQLPNNNQPIQIYSNHQVENQLIQIKNYCMEIISKQQNNNLPSKDIITMQQHKIQQYVKNMSQLNIQIQQLTSLNLQYRNKIIQLQQNANNIQNIQSIKRYQKLYEDDQNKINQLNLQIAQLSNHLKTKEKEKQILTDIIKNLQNQLLQVKNQGSWLREELNRVLIIDKESRISKMLLMEGTSRLLLSNESQVNIPLSGEQKQMIKSMIYEYSHSKQLDDISDQKQTDYK